MSEDAVPAIQGTPTSFMGYETSANGMLPIPRIHKVKAPSVLSRGEGSKTSNGLRRPAMAL